MSGRRALCLQLPTALISREFCSEAAKLAAGRTMFLCRTGRLSAAAVDQVFKSAGSSVVQVKADRLSNVTLPLRKDYTFHGHRCFCVDSTREHAGKRPRPVQNWHSPPGFVITDWEHLNRVAAIAVNLSKSVQSTAGHPELTRRSLVRGNRRHSSRGEPGGDVLFTGPGGISSRRCSSWTMQTRASSTKKSDGGEEQAADDKGVI